MRLRFSAFSVALICLVTCFAAPVMAEEKAASKQAGAPEGITAQRDILYVPGGDPAQSLDLYLPTKPSEKPLPLVVYIHGGGWQGGSKAGCPALGFVREGFAAASVEYRFSQKAIFPAQIQDCQAAIRWLRAHSKKYNLDPDHIGVWGDSAGGHLVALLGTSGGKKAFTPVGGNEDQSDRVQAVCDWYGPADFNTVIAQAAEDKNAKNIFKWNKGDPYSALIGGGLGEDKAKGDAVSPVHYVTRDNPPFLIMHGTHDTLVPFAQSEELRDALKKVGVDVLLQPFPGAGHGGPVFGSPAAQKQIKAFFEKNLKGMDVKVEPLPDSATGGPVAPK
ncbi:MAG TPA: alpha/beta hydrolase [Tepidisphaeraceae bacterium]|nr:alpha/beta hydrolase [Tepidisphaeraceae bacterium]